MNPLHVISLCAACASVAFAEQEVNLEAFTSKGQMMYSDTSRGFAKAQTRLSRHLEGCDPPNTHRMPREVLMARTVDRPEEVGRKKVKFDRQRR